jgi:hypothetical protein
MHFIAHRVNTIKDLLNTPTEYGVEIDLRDFGEKLILQHDPFKDGESFEEYLKNYNHGTMILNIKSEGIETRVLKLIQQHNIKSYFFVDCSFPMTRVKIGLESARTTDSSQGPGTTSKYLPTRFMKIQCMYWEQQD